MANREELVRAIRASRGTIYFTAQGSFRALSGEQIGTQLEMVLNKAALIQHLEANFAPHDATGFSLKAHGDFAMLFAGRAP